MATAPKTSPLPDSITRHAEFQARKAGITVNEWLAQMAALHLDTEEGAREFFRLRREQAANGSLRDLLDRVPAAPPDADDELD